jgi:copper chaperone CopZ
LRALRGRRQRRADGCHRVESVDVDLDAKSVTIRGRDLSDAALRAAIGQAGYEAA